MVRLACVLSVVALLGAPAPAAWAETAHNLTADPSAATPGVYTLDRRHSSLTARVMHLGFSHYTMRFGSFDATLDYVADDPTASRVEVTVDAGSVDTGSPSFDKRLAAEVFDADEHPVMRFVSTSIERTGPTTGKIHGDLTFRGVTRPMVLDARFNGGAPGISGKPRVGVSATGAFKRSEFGATEFMQFASDEVQLLIEAEFSQ